MPASSTSTTVPGRTGTYSSVACTAWPPGAHIPSPTPAAMHGDRRLRSLHELADAQHELGAGNAPRAGDAAAVIFLRRPRVHDHHVVAALHARDELGDRDLRCLELVEHA